jgi:hypothetical protein
MNIKNERRLIIMQRGNNEGEIHTTCTVCRKGLDLRDAVKCPLCRNFVHDDCFDSKKGLCDDCAK